MERVDLSCSAVSALDEPLAGTAGSGRRWLCLEHPGPWGRDILEAEVFGALTDAVAQWAERADARLLCVRRRRARRLAKPGQRAVLATTELDPGSSQARELEFADLRALIELDPEPLFAWDEAAWERLPGWRQARPVLVCAHGRRDQCCAVRGRPVAEALAEAGHDVWECSHTGGHRFAPSVIFLPDGSVYGRLSPEAAVATARASGEGRIELEGLRGRTCLTAREQVAEIAVLGAAAGQGGRNARVLRAKEREDGDVEIVLQTMPGAQQRFLVSIASETLPPRPASCGAEPKSVLVLRSAGIRLCEEDVL